MGAVLAAGTMERLRIEGILMQPPKENAERGATCLLVAALLAWALCQMGGRAFGDDCEQRPITDAKVICTDGKTATISYRRSGRAYGHIRIDVCEALAKPGWFRVRTIRRRPHIPDKLAVNLKAGKVVIWEVDSDGNVRNPGAVLRVKKRQ